MTLVGYWPLDESSGDAIDRAGSNDGSVNGSPYQGGQLVGTSVMSFDGSSEWVNTGFNLSSTCTIAAWMRTSESGTQIRALSSRNGGNGIIFRRETDGTIDLFANDGSFKSVSGDFPLNQWNHVSLVIDDGNELEGFINGESIGVNSLGTRNVGISLYIATRASDQTGNWSGPIADVRAYNHLLSPNEIHYLYEVGSNAYIRTQSKTG